MLASLSVTRMFHGVATILSAVIQRRKCIVRAITAKHLHTPQAVVQATRNVAMLAGKAGCVNGTSASLRSSGQRLAGCRPCAAACRPGSVLHTRQQLRWRCRAAQEDAQKGDEGPSSSFPASLEIPDGPDRPLTLREQLALEEQQQGLQQQETALQLSTSELDEDELYGPRSSIEQFMFPDKEELPDDIEMPVWDHLEELRERVLIAGLAAGAAILGCFCFSKELVVFLEAPVADAGVRFLQLSPGEFFFTTFKVAGYSGLLLAAPTVLYEIIAYVLPGLTKSERTFLAPLVFGSSILFYAGLVFSYEILTPAALNFFVSYAEGAVESLWSIDQYFQFVLVLMLSTGLSFQVPVIQVMLGQLRVVTSEQMFAQWRYVVVGATVVAAVLTPSTDPFTQTLLALPLIGLYFGGAAAVRALEGTRVAQASA